MDICRIGICFGARLPKNTDGQALSGCYTGSTRSQDRGVIFHLVEIVQDWKFCNIENVHELHHVDLQAQPSKTFLKKPPCNSECILFVKMVTLRVGSEQTTLL